MSEFSEQIKTVLHNPHIQRILISGTIVVGTLAIVAIVAKYAKQQEDQTKQQTTTTTKKEQTNKIPPEVTHFSLHTTHIIGQHSLEERITALEKQHLNMDKPEQQKTEPDGEQKDVKN